MDSVGGERRYAALADVATAARFCDALDHINIAGAMADPHDLPPAIRCVEVLADDAPAHHQAGHLLVPRPRLGALHQRNPDRAARRRAEGARSIPLCYPFLEPISPLRFPFNGMDLLYETARLNLPVPIGPMAQMGLSAPATIAGTLAQENAEILAGVVPHAA